MSEWNEIALDKPLAPGDKIRLIYNVSGPTWLKAIEAAAVEAHLENKEGYRLKRIDYQTDDKVIFYIDITKTNPVIVTCLVITGSILLITSALGWLLDRAEQATENPVVIAAAGSGVIIALAYLWKVLRSK